MKWICIFTFSFFPFLSFAQENVSPDTSAFFKAFEEKVKSIRNDLDADGRKYLANNSAAFFAAEKAQDDPKKYCETKITEIISQFESDQASRKKSRDAKQAKADQELAAQLPNQVHYLDLLRGTLISQIAKPQSPLGLKWHDYLEFTHLWHIEHDVISMNGEQPLPSGEYPSEAKESKRADIVAALKKIAPRTPSSDGWIEKIDLGSDDAPLDTLTICSSKDELEACSQISVKTGKKSGTTPADAVALATPPADPNTAIPVTALLKDVSIQACLNYSALSGGGSGETNLPAQMTSGLTHQKPLTSEQLPTTSDSVTAPKADSGI
jgi:hypothetical protein